MIIDILRKRTASCGEHIALQQEHKRLSYNTMWTFVDRYAEALNSAGLTSDDVIPIFASNSVELAIVYLAIWKIGAIPYPFHSDNVEALNYFLISAKAPKAVLVQKNWSSHKLLWALSRSYSFFPIVGEETLALYVCPSRKGNIGIDLSSKTAIWISSSSTTGPVKTFKLGVQGTLANISANAESLGLRKEDSTLMWLPMSYSYGLIGQFLSHLYVGSTIVFPNYNKLIHTAVNLIQQEHITTLFTIPILLRSILNIVSINQGAKSPCSSLRLITIGGGAIDRYNLQRALDLFEHANFAVTYGLAEAGPRVSTYFVRENLHHIGSVGHSIRGVHVKVVDEHRKDVGNEAEGEIVVFSPSVMQGYVIGSKEENFIPEKMIYTGDCGYISQDGYLYVLGRKSELICTKEHRVYLNEIKELLYSYQDIFYVSIVRDNIEEQNFKLIIHIKLKTKGHINKDDIFLLLTRRYNFSPETFVIDISHGLRSDSIKK